MKVSIIVPVYNVSAWIVDCLTSIAIQKYPQIECLLIDDCSPDDSVDKINQFLFNYEGNVSFYMIKHKNNLGLSAARNTGIKHATGEYLYFLDSDDELAIDAIQLLMELAIKDHPDFVIGDIKIVGNNHQATALNAYKLLDIKEKNILTNKKISRYYFYNKWYIMAWNKLIRRDFLLKNQLYFPDGLLHEDQLWSLKLAACADSMSICPRKTYIYKLRGNSITGSIKKKNINSLLAIFKLGNEVVSQYDSNSFLKGKLRSMASFIVRTVIDSSLEKEEKIDAISSIKHSFSNQHLYSKPLNGSDLFKMILLTIPANCIYKMLLVYKKITS